MLSVALYACEMWPLQLREQHELRVFENRMIKRIFGPKRKDMAESRNCIMKRFIT
jgi:hypothetical protein